jgi:alkylhydroperoxidase family enzyme
LGATPQDLPAFAGRADVHCVEYLSSQPVWNAALGVRDWSEEDMARLKPAPKEKYASIYGPDALLRHQIYANQPDLAAAFVQFNKALHDKRTLPARLLELVRLRVAFHNQCRSCMAIRYEFARDDEIDVTEGLVCSLERPQDAPDLTEAERAAIEYADLLATDHFSIDDGTFDRLREHFTEGQIMELLFNVATFVGFGRMAMSLDITDDLPDRFRADGTVTPWGEGPLFRVDSEQRAVSS